MSSALLLTFPFLGLLKTDSESKLKSYENTELKIRLEYPQEWERTLDSSLWGDSISFFVQDIDDSSFKAKVSLDIEPINDLITLDQHFSEIQNSILENHKSIRILNQKKVTMLDGKAYELTYEFIQNNKNIKKMAIITLRNNISYIFYYETDPRYFSKLIGTVKSVEDSIEFLDF